MILANQGRIFSGTQTTTTQNDLQGKSFISFNKNSRGEQGFTGIFGVQESHERPRILTC